jgi:GNAT superfamily N-acetyltransferase
MGLYWLVPDMNPTIRPFHPDDYPALAEFLSAASPEHPVGEDDLRFEDDSQGKRYKFARWLALANDAIVGEAAYGQDADMYHPRKFWIRLCVGQDVQGEGVGAALYEELCRALKPHEPISLLTNIREDHEAHRRFFGERGFKEVMRQTELRLVVAGFDAEAYPHSEARTTREGIEIKSYPELEADPERDYKLYRLRNELDQQVPFAEPVTPVPYAWFEERVLNHPKLLPGGLLVAVHKGDYAGMTALMKGAKDRQLDTDLTGVKNSYRRKGIALALKLRAIEYARLHNYTAIHTWVAASNQGMLAINHKLGFSPRPAWLAYVKVLKAPG